MNRPASFPRMKALSVGAVSPPVRKLYCSVAGTVEFVTAGGDEITVAMPTGGSLEVEVKEIVSLGTATLHGLYG